MNAVSGLYNVKGGCLPLPFLSGQHRRESNGSKAHLGGGNKKTDNFFLKLLDYLRVGASVIVFSSHFCFLVLRDNWMQ